MLLPAVCLAQPPEPPMDPPAAGKAERRGPKAFMEAWKRADTNHDGLISKAEFDAMPRIQNLPEEKRENLFKRLDKDANAELSREELGRFGKPHDGRDHPMKRLWELDSDKSGGISFEEFKAGQIFMKLPPAKQQAVFQRLDTDGDDMITPTDRPKPPFKHPKKKDGNPEGGGDAGQINRKLDLNGDDALSFEEFRQDPAVRQLTEDEQEDRFELLDRNADHQISADEFPPAPAR